MCMYIYATVNNRPWQPSVEPQSSYTRLTQDLTNGLKIIRWKFGNKTEQGLKCSKIKLECKTENKYYRAHQYLYRAKKHARITTWHVSASRWSAPSICQSFSQIARFNAIGWICRNRQATSHWHSIPWLTMTSMPTALMLPTSYYTTHCSTITVKTLTLTVLTVDSYSYKIILVPKTLVFLLAELLHRVSKKTSKIIFVIATSNFHQIWQFLAQRWQIVKKLYEVHSFSTSPNSRQCTTVVKCRCSKLLHNAVIISLQ